MPSSQHASPILRFHLKHHSMSIINNIYLIVLIIILVAMKSSMAQSRTYTVANYTDEENLKGYPDQLGYSLACNQDGYILAASAHGRDSFSGSVFIYDKLLNIYKMNWRPESSDKSSQDEFGQSLGMSLDTRYLVVGADSNTVSGKTNAGSAYVFYRGAINARFDQQAQLQANDFQAEDYFGFSTAISGDGNTVAVGAVATTHPSTKATEAGSVYIFTRSGSAWSQQAKLMLPDAKEYDYFGWTVAISHDGNTLVVGAQGVTYDGVRFRDENNTDPSAPVLNNAGAVFVYTRSGSQWTLLQTLLASDAAAWDQFGRTVFISSDARLLMVGVMYKQVNGAKNAGQVYVYEKNQESGVYEEKIKLTASDPAEYDYFGHSVSYSIKNDTIVVGAFRKTSEDGTKPYAGAVYVFTNPDSNGWTQKAKLVAANAQAHDDFGYAVALSSNAYTLFIGAPGKTLGGVGNTGVVYFMDLTSIVQEWESMN
ncbi:hypothetical protein C9374_001589 [Naegleria lovaniensis]|uniref:Uncharacterized protein n=1 Tax=Naegleria lovaniensis TaxID=51637 RepID=A0AA88GUH8_NAELO|nr:uncharacterized protein C9374_001589 [Naegleria lovaniensis]KAG2387257.1 hypothetical protein C9374_001589 [Naegleria lovaniensis]